MATRKKQQKEKNPYRPQDTKNLYG